MSATLACARSRSSRTRAACPRPWIRWAGSYYVEALTDELEREALALLAEAEARGGAARAIEQGFFQEAIARSAYERQRRVEAGDDAVVGVNRYADDQSVASVAAPDYEALAAEQRRRLADTRHRRDGTSVERVLARLRSVAQATDARLMPLILEAVRARATGGRSATCSGQRGESTTQDEVPMIGSRLRRSLVGLLVLARGLGGQQSPTVPIPDNLVIEGIPAIPAGLAVDVRRYTEARAATLSDWHPTRWEMLIATRFANTAQAHVVGMPLGARTQLTFFDEPVSGASYEPKDGRYVVFGKDVGGNEFVQLYRYDFGAARVALLTDGGRSQNGGVTWSRAGDRIAYGSTRRNGADRDLYVMDPANPSSDHRVLEVSGGGWSVLDWSPDDRRLLVMQYRSVNQSLLWLVDVTTGAKAALLPHPMPTPLPTVVPSSGRTVAGSTSRWTRGPSSSELAYLDLARQALTPLTAAIPWDVDEFDVSPDGRWVAFITNEAGIAKPLSAGLVDAPLPARGGTSGGSRERAAVASQRPRPGLHTRHAPVSG